MLLDGRLCKSESLYYLRSHSSSVSKNRDRDGLHWGRHGSSLHSKSDFNKGSRQGSLGKL